MASNIKINFNSPAVSGNILKIQDSNTPNTLIDIQFDTVFSSLPVKGDTANDIKVVYDLIQNKYNATNRYIVVANYVDDFILITDNIGNSEFTEVQNNTVGKLTTIINNTPVIIPVSISDVVLIQNSANPCSLVDIQITTNKIAAEITSPVISPVTTNPFTISNISRDSINEILISVNDGSSTDTRSIFVPELLPSLFNVVVTVAPNGSVVNITTQKEPYYDLQYSLDNVLFFESSSFSGLSTGNYILYIKDGLGCSTTIPFEVTAFDPNIFERVPYFNISEQNSLISVLRQDVDNISVFSNPLNTMSYEELSGVNNRNFKQQFNKKDGIITQQFRSNYNDTSIKLIDCNGTESIITPEKKSNNFDITDVRDVKILSVNYLGSSFVGVQYGLGNTYDPNTLVVNGSYNLGVIVPSFMNVGEYMQIEGAGWFKVINISYYDGMETLVLESLVNSFPLLVVGQTLKGTTKYNKLGYELYEFSFDCNTLSGDYYITYNITDSEFDNINYRTEWFNVSDNHLNTYLLQYYNSENNETNYSTGITNKIRIPYINTLTYVPNDTNDVYLTDTNAVNIESTYRDLFSLEVRPIPMGFLRKIGLAVSNDRLFLNGLSLLKNQELETERIGLNNVYKPTIQFVRSDYAFTNIADDGSIVLPSGDILGTNDNTEDVLGTKDNQ